VIVNFCCPQCLAVYEARQVRRTEERYSAFLCKNCGTPVHEWAGIYDFVYWRHVMKGAVGAPSFW
jgi:hypothetical protein